MSYAWGKTAYTTFSTAVSGAASYFYAPSLVFNGEVAGFLGTVVAVMAGLSISLLFFVGDPSVLSFLGKWKIMSLYRQTFKGTLARVALIIMVQFASLLAILTFFFTKTIPCTVRHYWVTHVYVFLAVLAILLTFLIPLWLYRSHLERYDTIIEELKKRKQ